MKLPLKHSRSSKRMFSWTLWVQDGSGVLSDSSERNFWRTKRLNVPLGQRRRICSSEMFVLLQLKLFHQKGFSELKANKSMDRWRLLWAESPSEAQRAPPLPLISAADLGGEALQSHKHQRWWRNESPLDWNGIITHIVRKESPRLTHKLQHKLLLMMEDDGESSDVVCRNRNRKRNVWSDSFPKRVRNPTNERWS